MNYPLLALRSRRHRRELQARVFKLNNLVSPRGFEPLAFWTATKRSIQLSYGDL